MPSIPVVAVFIILLCTSCSEDVLNFPTPPPAAVRIINTTQDVETLGVLIDKTAFVEVPRGQAANEVSAAAGRPISFVLKDGATDLLRDTLYYTLGGSARVILFARGSTAGLIEFRRSIQDTTLPATSDPVIRFTHMAENVSQYATLEVWMTGGDRLIDEDFDPGLSSSSYTSLPPGVYSFEVREYGTTNVAATITNITLEKGRSYMLYAYDAIPPELDRIALEIF